MAHRYLRKMLLIATVCFLTCISGVYATWRYFLPIESVTHSVSTQISEWTYLPIGNTTTELGESYTGVLEVVLNDLRYGINNNGLIVDAFSDKKLLEPGIVHSRQNNLSGGNLKNALVEANADHLLFVVQMIQNTNPVEYYLYIFETVNATKQTVGVYRVHLKTTLVQGVSDGIYVRADVRYGQAESYTPKGGGFISIDPLTWKEHALPST